MSADISSPARPFPWRFALQLLALALCAIGLNWIGAKVYLARDQKLLLETIGEGFGYEVVYDYEVAANGEIDEAAIGIPGPKWLREMFGDEYFRTPVAIPRFFKELAGDEDLPDLSRFTELKFICFSGVPITDAALRRLRPLRQLQHLDLSGTQVTGAALLDLKEFDRLTTLEIYSSRVNGPDLAILAALPKLRDLTVDSRQLANGGTANLQRLAKLEKLTVQYNYDIPEDYLSDLAELGQLKKLDLQNRLFSAADLEPLRAALPNCRVLQFASVPGEIPVLAPP